MIVKIRNEFLGHTLYSEVDVGTFGVIDKSLVNDMIKKQLEKSLDALVVRVFLVGVDKMYRDNKLNK